MLIKYSILLQLSQFILSNSSIAEYKKIQSLIFKTTNLPPKLSQIKKICYISGKERSVSRNHKVNRNVQNRLLISNKLSNIRIASW